MPPLQPMNGMKPTAKTAVKTVAPPRMVNRGAAGLLNKAVKPADDARPVKPADDAASFLASVLARHPDAERSKIAASLAGMTVPIASLTPDPSNARVHPERNMRAIMESLAAFGQVKPIVVRAEGMVVMAGNGGLEAAKRLGWTEIAASVVEMDDATAAAYGLADNRTAELATWDFATVARLERLIQEAGGEAIGWSQDELAALRVHDWTQPPTDFPEVDEGIEVEHTCPRCGYRFSGGEVHEAGAEDGLEEGTAEA
jgi:hypothetical protein